MTRFSKLNPDGSESDFREIKQSDLLKCPHVILVAEHYRPDGSCRCDDPEHKDMQTWGYVWDAGVRLWVDSDEGEDEA